MAKQHGSYTDEQKAAALADALVIGQSAAAAKYGIPRSTLATWQTRYELRQTSTLKKESLGTLAAAYLEANLQALTAQAYVASDPDYIKQQPASDLAVLHGVMADKSIRLLEALHAGQQAQLPDSD